MVRAQEGPSTRRSTMAEKQIQPKAAGTESVARKSTAAGVEKKSLKKAAKKKSFKKAAKKTSYKKH
jgi:hypothetical protein